MTMPCDQMKRKVILFWNLLYDKHPHTNGRKKANEKNKCMPDTKWTILFWFHVNYRNNFFFFRHPIFFLPFWVKRRKICIANGQEATEEMFEKTKRKIKSNVREKKNKWIQIKINQRAAERSKLRQISNFHKITMHERTEDGIILSSTFVFLKISSTFYFILTLLSQCVLIWREYVLVLDSYCTTSKKKKQRRRIN